MADLQWRDHVDPARACVQEYEAFVASLAPIARGQARAVLRRLMARAEQGRLGQQNDDSTEIKPVRRDPDIYELRWKVLTVHARMYHAEPGSSPDELWALNRHLKGRCRSNGREWTAEADQQEEIEYSATRYRELLDPQQGDA